MDPDQFRKAAVDDAASQAVEAGTGTRGKEPLIRWNTAGGIPVAMRAIRLPGGSAAHDTGGLRLHLELARLGLLRGFDQLLCLEGLTGVDHLPHQIETVRKVLRHFRGRVLLADEVGLGKTIEAGLLLREYLLRRPGAAGADPCPCAPGVAMARGVVVEVSPGVLYPAADAAVRPPRVLGRSERSAAVGTPQLIR